MGFDQMWIMRCGNKNRQSSIITKTKLIKAGAKIVHSDLLCNSIYFNHKVFFFFYKILILTEDFYKKHE